ncbi:MAG: glycosyltransferase, partial [Nitrosopumilus sp.]
PVQRPSNSLKGTRKVPNKVLSLGRFGVNKDQLFQINLAEMVPEGEFFIMGFVNNTKSLRYYKQCQRAIKSKGIKNVRLVKDANRDLVQKELKSASVFLHTMVDEPFGIATVESLFYGCLPLSHNSGGQKEIIGEDKFLYTSIEDAQIKLRWLISMVYSDANKIREQFFKKSQRFTLEKFIDEFYSILKTVNF